MDEHSSVADQPSVLPSIASVSVGEIVGRAIPLQKPSRRIKFLIEWREQTIPIVLDDSETLGTVFIISSLSTDLYKIY